MQTTLHLATEWKKGAKGKDLLRSPISEPHVDSSGGVAAAGCARRSKTSVFEEGACLVGTRSEHYATRHCAQMCF